MAIGTPTNLAADWHAGTSDTTASISPTTGAVLFALVYQRGNDRTDPKDSTAEFTISGLSGTWVEMCGETQHDGMAWSMFTCSDWSGSGTLSVAYAGAGTADSIAWIVDEVTGLDTTAPFHGLSRSLAGSETVDGADTDPGLVIGNDTAESAGTNGATYAWTIRFGDTSAWVATDYDDTNFDLIGQVDNDWNSHSIQLGTFFSSGADTTPDVQSGTGIESIGEHGIFLNEAGNAPDPVREIVLIGNEQKQDNGDSPDDAGWDPTWSVDTLVTSGVVEVDDHYNHAPVNRMLDVSKVGRQRFVHPTSVGDDDHWVGAAWFMDRDTSSGATNKLRLLLRLQDTSAATPDGYEVLFEKDPSSGATSTAQRYNVEINVLVAGVPTLLTSSSGLLMGDTNNSHAVLAEIVGSDITVWKDGTSVLTHDTTGDTDEYTTGLYAGFDHYRIRSSTNSQPFLYRWQAGTFTSAGAGPTWDGSFIRLSNGNKARVRMANGDAASLRLSNFLRL